MKFIKNFLIAVILLLALSVLWDGVSGNEIQWTYDGVHHTLKFGPAPTPEAK